MQTHARIIILIFCCVALSSCAGGVEDNYKCRLSSAPYNAHSGTSVRVAESLRPAFLRSLEEFSTKRELIFGYYQAGPEGTNARHVVTIAGLCSRSTLIHIENIESPEEFSVHFASSSPREDFEQNYSAFMAEIVMRWRTTGSRDE